MIGKRWSFRKSISKNSKFNITPKEDYCRNVDTKKVGR